MLGFIIYFKDVSHSEQSKENWVLIDVPGAILPSNTFLLFSVLNTNSFEKSDSSFILFLPILTFHFATTVESLPLVSVTYLEYVWICLKGWV